MQRNTNVIMRRLTQNVYSCEACSTSRCSKDLSSHSGHGCNSYSCRHLFDLHNTITLTCTSGQVLVLHVYMSMIYAKSLVKGPAIFTGSDITSQFFGKGGAWESWKAYPDVTEAFLSATNEPFQPLQLSCTEAGQICMYFV